MHKAGDLGVKRRIFRLFFRKNSKRVASETAPRTHRERFFTEKSGVCDIFYAHSIRIYIIYINFLNQSLRIFHFACFCLTDNLRKWYNESRSEKSIKGRYNFSLSLE